jgi:PmbA protein
LSSMRSPLEVKRARIAKEGEYVMEYENLKGELLSSVDTGLKYARTVDRAAEFELYLFYQNSAKVNIKQGVVEASDGIMEGNAVRVAKKNSVSFASSSGISNNRIKRSINEAVASLKSVSIKDTRFKGFCEPKNPGAEGIFASEILDLGKEELIKYARGLVTDGQEFDNRILMTEGICSAEWGGFAVGNTQGLQQASRSASNSCYVYCMAKDKEERRVGYEFDISRESLIKTEGMGEKAAQKAISLLGAQKLNKATVLPTIWDPMAAAAYIYASLGQSARGQTVVEKQSPLADKIGEQIANPDLTIVDDGQKPTGIMTEAIDAEGHPQQKTIIIKKGRLKQFMFDTYYARIYGTKSTGNCSRGGGPFGSTIPYETSPTISPRSIESSTGSKNVDDLIASIEGQAILIMDAPIGIFHSTISTGEFSAVAGSVFLIQDGTKKWPLQPVSVSGNFYKGLEKLLELGNDLKKTPFAVETPSLIFDGFSIVG